MARPMHYCLMRAGFPPSLHAPLAGGAGAMERRPGHSERRSVVSSGRLFRLSRSNAPTLHAPFSVSPFTFHGYLRPMRSAAAATLVFIGGFIMMVLEII